ncbi:MAG: AEC family transporter [Geminicoccaceae bacterium]
MEILTNIVLPVFAVIAAGYLATFTSVFDAAVGKALAKFVFWFAIPVMLFHSLATKDMPAQIDLGYFAAYYGGVGLSFALAIRLFRWLGHESFEFRVLAGFGSIYGNTVLVGIPVILAALGERASLPLFLLLSFHAVVLFSLVTFLVEGVSRGKGKPLEVAAGALKGLATNPILIGLVGGVLFNRAGLPMPMVLDRFGDLMAGAALPCALFSVGASLREYRIAGALRLSLAMIAVKMFVQPALVALLAFAVFRVDPLWASVAVIAAAMPTGVNAYLFAVRYEQAQTETAAAMLLSTILAVPVLTLILHWLT